MQIPPPRAHLDPSDFDDIEIVGSNYTWAQFFAVDGDEYNFWIVPSELRIFARPKTETQPPRPDAVRWTCDADGIVRVAANQ